MARHAAKSSFGGIKSLVVILLIFLLVPATAYFVYYRGLQADLAPVLGTQSDAVIFTVEKGWSLTKIATELEGAGLIRNAKSFIAYGKKEKMGSQLQAGSYMLSSSMSVQQMMGELVKGRIIVKKFTIPEGYHLRQICKTFVQEGLSTEEAFWEAVKNGNYDYDFLKSLPNDEKRLEGYLFPDTYTIPEGMAVEKILDRMLRRFVEVYQSLPENKSGLPKAQVVTLASIVENEAKLDEERPIVASVFLNRLRDGIRLESCATIQYHYEEKKARLLFADLEIDSPYNTYRKTGLPPGPICSPGRASLEAVANPAQTDYYFFVAKEDGSGGHVFSKSLSEHNKAKWTIRN